MAEKENINKVCFWDLLTFRVLVAAALDHITRIWKKFLKNILFNGFFQEFMTFLGLICTIFSNKTNFFQLRPTH